MKGNKKSARQYDPLCPVGMAIAAVGGKWKPWILWHLHAGVRRFGELRRLTPGITKKMLTQHLRELETDGIVKRKIYAEKMPRVEYAFTKYGATLRPVLKVLCHWGAKHGKHVAAQSQRKAGPVRKAENSEISSTELSRVIATE